MPTPVAAARYRQHDLPREHAEAIAAPFGHKTQVAELRARIRAAVTATAS